MNERRILKILKVESSASDISEALGVSRNYTSRYLKELAEEGVIRRRRVHTGTAWKYYYRHKGTEKFVCVICKRKNAPERCPGPNYICTECLQTKEGCEWVNKQLKEFEKLIQLNNNYNQN